MKDLFYEVIVTDKHGKVIDREAAEARSWLVAYILMMFGCFNSAAQTIKCIDGATRAQNINYPCFNAQGVADNIIQGIVVGTGSTPVDIEDYILETQIVNGSGAGQLLHLAQINASPVVDATSSAFILTRSFLNNSGGSITVREIGIYGMVQQGPEDDAALVRDVLASGKVVPDGGAITVKYTIRHAE